MDLAHRGIRSYEGLSATKSGRSLAALAIDALLHLARLHVTVPTPPLDAEGVTYLSSSLLLDASNRLCSVPFQLGNVALSTLKLSVLSPESTE